MWGGGGENRDLHVKSTVPFDLIFIFSFITMDHDKGSTIVINALKMPRMHCGLVHVTSCKVSYTVDVVPL